MISGSMTRYKCTAPIPGESCPRCGLPVEMKMGHLPALNYIARGQCERCGMVLVTGEKLRYGDAIAIAEAPDPSMIMGAVWFD